MALTIKPSLYPTNTDGAPISLADSPDLSKRIYRLFQQPHFFVDLQRFHHRFSGSPSNTTFLTANGAGGWENSGYQLGVFQNGNMGESEVLSCREGSTEGEEEEEEEGISTPLNGKTQGS